MHKRPPVAHRLPSHFNPRAQYDFTTQRAEWDWFERYRSREHRRIGGWRPIKSVARGLNGKTNRGEWIGDCYTGTDRRWCGAAGRRSQRQRLAWFKGWDCWTNHESDLERLPTWEDCPYTKRGYRLRWRRGVMDAAACSLYARKDGAQPCLAPPQGGG